MNTTLDIGAMWSQGDTVSHVIFVLLAALSIVSWAIILGKTWQLLRLRRNATQAIERFWHAPGIEQGIEALKNTPAFAYLAAQGAQAARHIDRHSGETRQLNDHIATGELITRALRQALNRANSHLENGQTFLASVGSTAPFIGLFGTVWGIYHALVSIGASGKAGLDQVAGPVGEALIMTALGLAVAIPAVLAYNAFNRGLSILSTELDGFAHDLHVYFTTGYPLNTPVNRPREHAPVAMTPVEAV
ncbi:MAG: MotA/TolQ/ExbB proton channel family protein [Halothiobacillaceae bacterium]|nr:MotA/TolQ/ExbB proton channel family protein [Halothiobacillaceae bacterium]